MVAAIDYAQNLAQDQSRGPSDALWAGGNSNGAPVLDILSNPKNGQYFFDDFNDFPDFALYNGERQLGQWDAWVGNNSGATIGTGADTTNLPIEGGVIGLIGGTTGIDVTMVAGAPAYRLATVASGNAMGTKLWFECRVAFSTATTAYGDLFVGLMDPGWAGTHITSAASLCFSATNTIKTTTGMGGCIGFWKRATTNPTDWAVVSNVNNGTAQLPDSGVGATSGLQKILTNSGLAGYTTGLTAFTSTSGVAAANSFVKLGFLFDPTNSCPTRRAVQATTSNQVAGSIYSARVQFFMNGILLPWFLTTKDVMATTFPLTWLAPTIGYRSGGTGDGIGYVDWVRCCQLAQS